MAANGDKLKQARLKQGKSIQDLAAQTRISVQFLEAMEADNLEAIPGEFFRRSFLKQYASALGVNPDEVQPERPMEFRALGGPSAEPSTEVRYHEPPDLPPLPAMGQSRGLPWRQVFLSIGLLVGVLAVCAVAYTLWEDAQSGGGEQENAAVQLQPPPMIAPESPAASTEPGATPSVLDGATNGNTENAAGGAPASGLDGGPAQATDGLPAQPQATAPGGQTSPAAPAQAAATQTPAAATNAAPVTGVGLRELRLSASATTWVQAREGDRTVFVGVLNPGETRVLRVNEGARLVVGNAGGLNVAWQGEDVSPVGPLGQVRIVTVSAEGVSVAAPVKNPPSTQTGSAAQPGV